MVAIHAFRKEAARIAAFLMLAATLLLSACGTPKNTCELYASDEAAEGEQIYTPGTYEAKAWGFAGNVTVEITFSETDIRYLRIEGPEESGKGKRAIEKLAYAIMDSQSPEVDGVSGATLTSGAIAKAAQSCFQQASI